MKVKVRFISQPLIPTGIVIRDGLTERVGVTTTGQFLNLGGLNTSAQDKKGKEKVVGQSQGNSSTPIVPKLFVLYKDIEGTTYEDIEDIYMIASRRRTISQAL